MIGVEINSNIIFTTALFDKGFECSFCLDDMKPPVKIFQCRNGHVMCESCKNHPEGQFGCGILVMVWS